jgi:transcriptional regulator with XRE-family HTH domain
MDAREERRQRFLRDQQIKQRLRLATTRLHQAEQERIWAIVAARDAGLSIRQIATATGLSRSRIHQLLQDAEAREIPTRLTHLRGRAHTSDGEVARAHAALPATMQARVADEVEVLRWCIDWLAQLERGEMVVVNLRPDTEDVTEFVRFDQARVRRGLARIAADLDMSARHGPATDAERPEEPTDPRTRHRRRLAESDEKPRGRTAKEQRDALRHAFGLPPYSGDYAEYFRQTRGTNT